MATEKESPCQNYCANDPNFAIICSFFDRFALTCGITYPTFAELQEMIENTQDVPAELIDLHVKLLRKIRRSVATEKWERALIKFCHSYLCSEEGWELERCGYKKCKVPVRLKILKTLLDAQFDLNSKFKNDINKLTPEELRLEPLGRDKVGQSYWCQFDSAANVRVYKEDQDEETWALVAKDREGLVGLITQLSSGEELLGLELINEDSNSQEVEKPIIDTGQVEQSTSEENTVDSDASKIENPVKEEDSLTNDVPQTGDSSNENSQKEVLEDDKSSEIKTESDKEKPQHEPNKCTLPSNDSHDEVCPQANGVECQQDKLEFRPISNGISQLDRKCDITENADEKSIVSMHSQKTENESLNDNGVTNVLSQIREQPKVNPAEVTREIKDVTEEIKQRSLFKSSSSTLFKGKIGKSSSGSKLDKIFSRKLEQSNFLTSHDKNETVDIQEKSVENKILTDEDSCSQTSVLSNEPGGESVSDEKQGKRKPDESCDQPTKRQCVELEPESVVEPEVGEEIEEPLMIIKGEGSGQECDTGNPGKDDEEAVTSGNMNNDSSNKSEITITKNLPNENSSEDTIDVISLKSGLNNGIPNDNCEVNEVLLNKDKDCIQNCTDPSKKDESECNVAQMKDVKSPLCTVNIVNEEKEEPEMEKSIEEQLSDLTGEGLSPNSNVECPKITENSKENVTGVNNKDSSEKGIRRKSLDLTDNEDHESIPPEAKKTKVQKDCSDIFGTDDSMPYSIEENKFIDDKVISKESVSNVNVSKDKMVPKMLEQHKLSMNNEVMNENTNLSSIKNTSENKTAKNKNSSNFDGKIGVDSYKGDAIKEICSDKTKPESQEDKDCLSDSTEQDTVDPSSKSDSKENSTVKEEESVLNELKTADKVVNLDEPTSITVHKESELNPGVEDGEESVHNKRNVCGEQNLDKAATPKSPENESECPEKKKKTVSYDEKTSEDKEKNISHVKDERLDDRDKSAERSDSSLKDESKGTENKRKAPLKKSPKPRRKVFTPKSRKRSNKNKSKDIKAENSENSSLPENKNCSKKLNLEEKVPCDQLEAKEVGDSISDNKETDQTIEAKPMPIAGRKRRNSRKNTNTEKESEEDLTSDKKANTEADDEDIGGKRRKVKGKRAPNKTLRKSIEDKRNCKSSSEEENHSDDNSEKETKKSPKESKKTAAAKKMSPTKSPKSTKSNQGKSKVRAKSPPKSKKDEASKIKKEDTKDENSDESSEKKKKKPKSQGRNSRAFLGIDLDIDLNDTSRSVRQSSRLAQIKIKEQADNKHGEEALPNIDKPGKKNKKKKDDNEEALRGTPKKKKKTKKISDDDVPEDEPLSERKRRKKKKKHPVKAFNERDPWKSSSGSSSEAEEEEEDHFDDIVEEEEELPIAIKSDHEFSPESDLEADEEWKPVRRARTAQKVKEPTEEAEESSKDLDDFACEKCGKKDHPEWILLCDTCNHGWHASCLRPSLMLVPEGDWHCPPCQHAMLVKSLQETLKTYDADTKRRENEELRRKRLAYVGISLDNVLPANAHHPKEKASGSESSESSESGSESESQYSDEPVYQLRQRRQGATSYRFNEFDELINSAIREEVEGSGAVFPAPVPTAEVAVISKEGEEKPKTNENGVEVNGDASLTNSVPDVKEKPEKPKKKSKEESDQESSEEEEDSKNEEEEEDEFPRVVPKRTALPRPGRKKHRKLNSLDDPSDDDDDDEDFKGSSSEEEEEDEEEDSDESGVGRRRSRRGNLEPVRRSSRARKSRFDKEFINDDSEESDAPRRKKTKKLWSESDSESDDSTWGRRKKKKSFGSSRGRKFQKSKKFTIEDELSDIESSKTPKKKRQRKIKYGGLDDLAVEDLPSRRTRGKKINYVEVLGTDSDEDIQKSKSFKKAVIDDDDEFDAEKEKEESAASSGGAEESDIEDKSTEDEDEEEEEGEAKEIKIQNKNIQNIENENQHKKDEKDDIKIQNEKINITPNKVSPPKAIPPKVYPPKLVNKDKPPARRGRPPKAMIAPPPERLVSEDEQYKAVVSKVATVGHNMNDIRGAKAVNVSEYPQKFSETKDFMEPLQPVTPMKIPNSSFDPKLVKRSPPIKIRSGVPVNAGVKSPSLGSPTGDIPLFPVKSPNSGPLHSPPDGLQFQMQRSLMPQQPTTARKSINAALVNVKTEGPIDEEDDLDDEDLMEEIEEEEEEEEDDEDDSDDDVLEVGEIPKKVARRMARIEERMEKLEKRKLAKQVEKLKSVKTGAVTIQPVSPGAAQPPTSTPEQKPTPTTQPTQPLLRVVSPLKLMANPPGPLQSTFMNPNLSPRMPIGSPPPARMPMQMRPPQPTPIVPGGDGGSRRGRGRGKKQEKEEVMVPTGGSVIRGMLQQPQSYPPAHYQQQYPPAHPRIPYNPQQRMPRPPFHPGHPHPLDPSPSGGGPINVKQEPGAHPVSNPVHIPNKPPASSAPPYHPQHRFDSRPPGYPPQANPRPPYGSYPPPPVSGAGYHYGSYPPPPQPSMAAPPAREEYVAPPPQQYNEQFSEQPAVPPPPTNKSFSEEEGSGEFGGLVSYFSSQREEDLDT